MKCLINLFSDAQLNFNEWQHGKNYSASVAEIAKLWQTKKLGFHIEILNPKSFSCPYHQHQEEEELFIILKGSGTVRQWNQWGQTGLIHEGRGAAISAQGGAKC